MALSCARTGNVSGGDITDEPKGSDDFWVLKIDANGNKIWDKRYGGAGWDGLARMLETTDGGYLLGGHSQSNISGDKSENAFGKADFWVLKIDADGAKVWDKPLVDPQMIGCPHWLQPKMVDFW